MSVDHRRIVEVVETDPVGGAALPVQELAIRLGLAVVAAKIGGVRPKTKRLTERGRPSASATGRFTPSEPTAAVQPATRTPSG